MDDTLATEMDDFDDSNNQKEKKKKKKQPTNLMKLLFLPLDYTFNILREEEWEQLFQELEHDWRPKTNVWAGALSKCYVCSKRFHDKTDGMECQKCKMSIHSNPRCKAAVPKCQLATIPTRDLRTACRQRQIATTGSKKDIIGRLMASIMDQYHREEVFRAAELEKLRMRLRMEGGCFAWGYGLSGQLGNGKRVTTSKPQHVEALSKDHVVKVFAGFDGDTVYALTALDNVYVWGSQIGATGQKKWTAEAPDDNPLDITTDEIEPVTYENNTRDEAPKHEGDMLLPIKIPRICGERIIDICPGRRSCIARTRDGDVYSWGHNHFGQLGPLMIHNDAIEGDELIVKPSTEYADTALPMLAKTNINSHVRSISCSADGSLVSLRNGSICIWGNPKGNGTEDIIRNSISNIKVKQVACGASHSCFIDTKGSLFSWGNGDGGRLGHGDSLTRHTPTFVEALKDKCVLEVKCAVWHSVAIVMVPPMRQGGWVYTWGSGFHGQLAQETQKFIPTPTPIMDFIEDGVYARHTSCGRYHTAIIATTGRCYTWGSNRYGCLGRKDELMGMASSFTPVPGYVEYFAQPFLGKVVSVACGRHFTACVLAPYGGPDEEEMAKIKAERKREKDGIKRVKAYLKRKEEAERWRKALERRAAIIDFLNGNHHTGCTFCDTPYDCPGFQPDFYVPTICRHCEHERDYHTLLRYMEDKKLTNEMLDEFDEIIRANPTAVVQQVEGGQSAPEEESEEGGYRAQDFEADTFS